MPRPWSLEEDTLLKSLMQKHNGQNWKEVAEELPGRTGVQCLHRWISVLHPGRVTGPWSKTEDDVVLKLVQQHGPQKWDLIAEFVPGRNGKQCRERWYTHLDPARSSAPVAVHSAPVPAALHTVVHRAVPAVQEQVEKEAAEMDRAKAARLEATAAQHDLSATSSAIATSTAHDLSAISTAIATSTAELEEAERNFQEVLERVEKEAAEMDLRRESFTPAEEALIINAHRVLGTKWAKIAAFLPGRSDNAIKNQHSSLQTRYQPSHPISSLLFPLANHPEYCA